MRDLERRLRAVEVKLGVAKSPEELCDSMLWDPQAEDFIPWLVRFGRAGSALGLDCLAWIVSESMKPELEAA